MAAPKCNPRLLSNFRAASKQLTKLAARGGDDEAYRLAGEHLRHAKMAYDRGSCAQMDIATAQAIENLRRAGADVEYQDQPYWSARTRR
jgi:hypothetical protein